ncbi:PREDICTED: uncharacterized protein LOC104612811 [Nelumbo nucifera]|uniref:Uncharacterized protein LOC104612811 n=2 Tax=Nelumbo nucifera TaxID=4432 RepID=A0A1U8BF95_NELNU|nr:PREDICTED: uncharacterized protein LOC104612811 [Nelumbo nucifera]DAD40542.1 TPA_asm: hypothetical protein HUJ06_014865 [Nelumbo nucifera]
MGNCMRHESSMTWAGEDWGSPASDGMFVNDSPYGVLSDKSRRTSDTEKESLLGEKIGNVNTSTEVKIKISKKQLEELLGRVDVRGLSVEQILGLLQKVSDHYQTTTQHRSWRPALQSIPESVTEQN